MDTRPECDAGMQTGGVEAPGTRKRTAETDAERLEEDDPNNSKVENAVMRSCGVKTMTPTMRSTCSSVSSVITTFAIVHETGTDIQCVRSPRHYSHMTSVDGITPTTRVTSC